MNYKITKQYPSQQENDVARFVDVNDAKLAVNELFARDHQQKTKVVYRLFDKYGDIVLQLDTNVDKPSTTVGGSAVDASLTGGATGSAGGSGQTSGFRPTPFSTTPTPPGGPKKWTTLPPDEDKKDEDEKK